MANLARLVKWQTQAMGLPTNSQKQFSLRSQLPGLIQKTYQISTVQVGLPGFGQFFFRRHLACQEPAAIDLKY